MFEYFYPYTRNHFDVISDENKFNILLLRIRYKGKSINIKFDAFKFFYFIRIQFLINYPHNFPNFTSQ